MDIVVFNAKNQLLKLNFKYIIFTIQKGKKHGSTPKPT